MKLLFRPWLCLAAAVAACSPLIAGYSLQAYTNDTTLKADVAALTEESTEPYATHAKDVAALTLRLHEAYEFSKGEAANTASTAQWDLLIDPNGQLYGKFVKTWRASGSLSQCAAANWKVLLDRGFDQLICLEANKQQATNCPAPEPLPDCAANGGTP